MLNIQTLKGTYICWSEAYVEMFRITLFQNIRAVFKKTNKQKERKEPFRYFDQNKIVEGEFYIQELYCRCEECGGIMLATLCLQDHACNIMLATSCLQQHTYITDLHNMTLK